MVIKDDIRLIKPLGNLAVGRVYTIGNINKDNNTFIISQVRDGLAVASITYEELNECFVKQEDRKWTDWISDELGNALEGNSFYSIGQYRTNGKKIQYRILISGNATKPKYVVGTACCNNTTDNYNFAFGVDLAKIRCLKKRYKQLSDMYINNYKDICSLEQQLLDRTKVFEKKGIKI